MKKVFAISLLTLSLSAFAEQKIVCGTNEAEINNKIAALNPVSLSDLSVAIAKAAPGIAKTGNVERTAVETSTLICVAVKY